MGFGENLIKLRESRGISRKELAVKLGIPYTTLRNYETNLREPGHKLLIQIAQIFSVSVDSLVGLDHDKDDKKSPSTNESVPGEDVLGIFNYLNTGLISLGLIGEGEDITEQQADILISVARILRASFDK